MSVADSHHSGLMDAVYRHQRHIYDISRKYYLLGRDRLIADLAPAPGDTVLEIGCGTGRNLILAARRYPQARFHGIDISTAMLATARKNVGKAGLTHRITLAQGDAADFDAVALFGIPAFERVFIAYALSMIPAWQAAIGSALAATAEEGCLHIVDFGQQERLPLVARRVLQAWLRRFHVTPRADLAEVFGHAASAAGMTSMSRPLHRGYAWLLIARR